MDEVLTSGALCSTRRKFVAERHARHVFVVQLQADRICYAVLCVFSYVAAGNDQQQQQ